MSELAFKSALALAELVRTRRASALELLEHYIERLERFNPSLNAIVVRDIERARVRAREADAALARGEIWGPLHGVPMTIKESYDVEGLPTTRGDPAYREHSAERHSVVVERLRNAGVVLFGKTNVPLNLADFQSYNEVYGTTNNPWDLGRGPGGSSGGSAAVLAAGLAGLEAGSDIGGSIRNPSHYCGVFGHKPTYGIVPLRGHAAPGVLAPSDLSVVGPMARSAADLEVALLAMAGPDELEAAGNQLRLAPCPRSSLGDFKVAVWPNDDRAPVSAETEARVRMVAGMVEECGGEVDFEARPAFDFDEAQAVFATLLQSVMASRSSDEVWSKLLGRVAKLDSDDRSARAQTLRRQTATYRDYARAHEQRTHIRWAWHEFFKRYDVLLTPVMASPAFAHDHRPFGERTISVDGLQRPYFEQLFWMGHAINAYLPATVVPTGAKAAGLPIGVQIIGPEYGDLKTIGFARLLEAAGLSFVAPAGY